jgi:TonB family protein
VRDVKPVYTADAMRARITGTVGLSCVIDRDGTVRACRLTRSLDRDHRLDEPVPVRVTIDMAFSLR